MMLCASIIISSPASNVSLLFAALSKEMQATVVEMDIINTPEVQNIRSQGTLPLNGRSKRAATRNQISLWTNNTIPYKFHFDVGKLY
jgi:hypothetical protein